MYHTTIIQHYEYTYYVHIYIYLVRSAIYCYTCYSPSVTTETNNTQKCFSYLQGSVTKRLSGNAWVDSAGYVAVYTMLLAGIPLIKANWPHIQQQMQARGVSLFYGVRNTYETTIRFNKEQVGERACAYVCAFFFSCFFRHSRSRSIHFDSNELHVYNAGLFLPGVGKPSQRPTENDACHARVAIQ